MGGKYELSAWCQAEAFSAAQLCASAIISSHHRHEHFICTPDAAPEMHDSELQPGYYCQPLLCHASINQGTFLYQVLLAQAWGSQQQDTGQHRSSTPAAC